LIGLLPFLAVFDFQTSLVCITFVYRRQVEIDRNSFRLLLLCHTERHQYPEQKTNECGAD
jgi:hypothetical protein